MHAAAYNGHAECLRILLENAEQEGAVDIVDDQGRTPLMVAVSNGHIDATMLLLDHRASPTIQDVNKRTALHRAAANGHEECCDALLGVCNSTIRDINGRSALHMAAACGHEGILGSLLQLEPTNHLDNKGYTPLHWACYNGHDNCVELLLEQDANMFFEGNSFSALHCSVLRDNEVCAEMLIDALADEVVNIQDSKGRTPLHAAALNDQVECMQLLLKHGGQPNIVDKGGKTCFMIAAESGSAGTIELLVTGQIADISLSDETGNSALHLACQQTHEGCALMILEKIDDVRVLDMPNAKGETPLHIASAQGLVTVVQDLITRGASLLTVDNQGYTPALSCASSDKVADCLALILAHMMPFSPGNSTINSSRIALALSGELGRTRTSTSLDFNDGNRSRTESNADTSDSETY